VIVYKYTVSKTPATWGDGKWFGTFEEARDHMSALGAGLCVTEVAFTFEESELVLDERPESEKE